MNVIKKYWESVYIYILLLEPGLCICAGTYWSICKLCGLYSDIPWEPVIVFDCTQLVYLVIGLYFIYRIKKESEYIHKNLVLVKSFIVISLFIQYNLILYIFSSIDVWECTFVFYSIIAFLFDSKLMLGNILAYGVFLIIAHILRPEMFLPIGQEELIEAIAYRILMYVIISMCFIIIVYFAEHFLAHARRSNDENTRLMEKQLKYYQDMELLDTELRKFRHDIKNHFVCMEWLMDNKKFDDLHKYFDDLDQSFSVHSKIHFSGNDIIDAILHHDLPYLCDERVKSAAYGNLPVINTVTAMDLCTLFSNMLSNAIAAANKCADNDRDAEIIIRFSSGKTYFCIEVSNSVLKEEAVVMNESKDRNHGHGVPKIKDVVEKYNGGYETNIEDDMVTITIFLPI